jgi:sirohydrochlorin cobaltochelatase
MVTNPLNFLDCPTLFDVDARLNGATLADGLSPVVLAAFGTSSPESWGVYRRIDEEFRARFRSRPVLWAFTSRTVRRKLQAKAAVAHSARDVFSQLVARGYRRAVVQPLQVSPGQEYHRLRRLAVAGLQLTLGRTLLHDEADIPTLLELVEPGLCRGATNILVLHGNDRFPEYNARGLALADLAERRWPDVFAASLEGAPGTGPLRLARGHAASTGWAHFLPLLLTRGMHVVEDVMGSGPESWRTVVGARRSTCSPPLGENSTVAELLARRLEPTLDALQSEPQ